MLYFGWKKDKWDERDYLHTAKPKIGEVPDFFVQDSNVLPSVRDQGRLGSCTGFGIGGNLTGTAKKLKCYEGWFSPTWIYNGGRWIAGDLMYDTGAYPRDCFKFIHEFGCLLEDFYLYKDVLDTTCPLDWNCASEAKKWPVLEYYRVVDGVDGLCSALAEGNFVSLGSPWYSSWLDVNPDGRLPEDYRLVVGGHATFLYGYDKKAGVFFGQNSWGTDWGCYGRFKLPFSAIDAFKKSWGYDAHYVKVNWSAQPEPEPVIRQGMPAWIWVAITVGILGLVILLLK